MATATATALASSRHTPAILIVGAGPTGLTLAHELLRHGLRPRLIERLAAPSLRPKALGVLARTLELLAPAGVTPLLLAQGVRVPIFAIWSNGRQLARLDFADGRASPYPFTLMLPQHITEAILTERIARLGGSIERGVELVGLTQHAAGIVADLRHADGHEERVRCDYLAGCDGAHSTVRHLLGVPFAGTAVAQRFATGKVRLRWDHPYDEALAFLNRGHLIAYFPLPNGYHQFLSVAPPDAAAEGEITLEDVRRTVARCGPAGAEVAEASWMARYAVHQRKVAGYVHGRVLLAGDAAHVHSPLGAQGMNTGMQDALNLAWKLALVARGQAPTRLLASYSAERARVGSLVLLEDVALTRIGFLRAPLATAARDVLASRLTAYPPLRRFLTDLAGGLSLTYAQGPLAQVQRIATVGPVGRAAGMARVGDRAPDGPLIRAGQARPSHLYALLSGTQHALLLFARRSDAATVRAVRAALAPWGDHVALYPIAPARSDAHAADGESSAHGADAAEHAAADTPDMRRVDGTTDAGHPVWRDPDGALAAAYGIGAAGGLVLLRPDGYICARAPLHAPRPLRAYLRALCVPPPA